MSHRAICSRCQGTGFRLSIDGSQVDCWVCMGAIFIDDCNEDLYTPIIGVRTQPCSSKDDASPTKSQYALEKAIEAILRNNMQKNIKQGQKIK